MSLSTPAPPHSRTPTLFHFALIALTLTRWLLPTEAASEGDTLWIAGLWFAMGAVYWVWGRKSSTARRADGADLAVALFLGGHVLSGQAVINGEGDRRAALNLIWEWLSLGVCWLAWRDLLRAPETRRCIVPLLLVTAGTLSLWGLWQYFVWYPQMQQNFGPMFDQVRSGDLAAAAAARQKLQEAGVPTDGPALRLFENRLRNSREPFGPFALANTLGGLLVAWLIVAYGSFCHDVLGKRSVATRDGSWLVALSLIPMAVCLYLTNSRTAWAGMIIGVCAGGLTILSRRASSPTVRRGLLPVATLVASLGGIGGLVWLMQGEHRVPGPLKSLAYRAEYWIGTAKLIATTPWLGAGLGQFRDRYLAFKLPETSEEIADPHNLVLDVWANGGVIAVLGLLALIAVIWHHIWRLTIHSTPPSPPPATAGHPRPRSWLVAGLAGFAVTILGQWLVLGVWDDLSDRVAIFALVWLAVGWFWPTTETVSSSYGWLAALALAVHLLGAGGIAMPAVTQMWLLLIAWGLSDESAAAPTRTKGQFSSLLMGGVCALGCAACCWSSVWPVAQVKRELAQGDFLWQFRGDSSRAEQAFRRAISADAWSSEPWERLAELEFARAVSRPGTLDRTRLEAALRAETEAIARSPHRVAVRLRMADMLAEAAGRSRRLEDWRAAEDAYREVVPRAPTNALLLARAAHTAAQTGNPVSAADLARRALDQDALNHRRNHTDRYLSDALQTEMKQIAEVDLPR